MIFWESGYKATFRRQILINGLQNPAIEYNARFLRRGGRVAEGAPLLREYGVKNSIEGSNPSLTAIYFIMHP